MKKLFAILLAVALVLGLAACGETASTEAPKPSGETQTQGNETEPAPAKEITQVDYYCSIGAYLLTLEEKINEYNEGKGKQEGVFINLTSNINTYSTDLKALMEAGTHYDLIDKGTGNPEWILQDWIQDLNEIDDADLKALIESYREYLVDGVNTQQGILYALPLEVVPIKLAINVDLFEKNGLDYKEMKTWDDMYEYAKKITENGNGVEFGYGWSTWGACWRRLTFKATMSSTGKAWWDPNTGTFDFSPFKKQCEIIKKMYEEDIMLGADDLAIDPIRARFAMGQVAMFPAPAYDYAVYMNQMKSELAADEYNLPNWTVIDMPAVTEEGRKYKGVYLDRVGCSIDKVNYSAADAKKKEAIVKAFIFLNSDELNQAIYEVGGMIPYKDSVRKAAHVSEDLGPQWSLFGDLDNYTSMCLYPDSLCKVEGDNYAQAFKDWMQTPGADLDALIEDLNTRYNAAYQALKASGDADLSIYEYEYNIDAGKTW